MITRALSEIGLADIASVGGKAARLGHLARAGLRVPDGCVIPAALWRHKEDCRVAVAEVLSRLGPGKLAVRSSGIVEDLAGASFAGQYESVLNVEGEDAVMAAVGRCWESAGSDRILIYASQRAAGEPGPMAVLIQRMVDASVAGVAYSANPLTGERSEVLISAARGLGDAVVGGESVAEEWTVRDEAVVSTLNPKGGIDAERALEIATLARKVESILGEPQDVEWAISGEDLYLLQARPITALPAEVSWDCPVPRGFARHFRFGEWIGDPVTPLFESWLLTFLEEAMHERYRVWFGMSIPRPFHVLVNGWYFYCLPALPDKFGDVLQFLGAMLPKLLTRPRRVAMMMPPMAHLGIEGAVQEWRETALPHHLTGVVSAAAKVETEAPRELVGLVDETARDAGVYFAYITLVAGFAAKAEVPLASFYKRNLQPRIGGSHLDLLQGLVADDGVQAHAVQSLDWYFPTAGETGRTLGVQPHDERRTQRTKVRVEAERRAREALANDAGLARAFEKLLAIAQRFQPLREECAGQLTRGWPAMRRAIQRLGAELVTRNLLDDPSDIYFLERAEVISALEGATTMPPVAERRAIWQARRRLTPPLVIGSVAPMARKMIDDFVESSNSPSSARGIRGVAASPGRVTGAVRVIRDESEFDLLAAGEVLVAPVVTPAWTALFAKASALVTDTGSIGSHASQVAREYGIPAVVCTGDATGRLRPGQVVTVDGSAGIVEVAEGVRY